MRALSSILFLATVLPCLRAGEPAGCLRIPPELESRTLFYHSFSHGLKDPDVNPSGVTVRMPTAQVSPAGLTGPGLVFGEKGKKPAALSLVSPEFRPSRPLTISFWWRLDQPMQPETCFHLLTLQGGGIVSNFVRGKGGWCGLKQPTYVQQVYYFKNMNNHNQLGGRVWFEPGEWHHAAMVFRNANRVQVYWDGALRTDYAIRGRPFSAKEGGTLDIGPTWLFHPMTIDEILVLDRALDGAEVQAYMTSVQRLSELADTAHD
jgi:hypothetical protein